MTTLTLNRGFNAVCNSVRLAGGRSSVRIPIQDLYIRSGSSPVKRSAMGMNVMGQRR